VILAANTGTGLVTLLYNGRKTIPRLAILPRDGGCSWDRPTFVPRPFENQSSSLTRVSEE